MNSSHSQTETKLLSRHSRTPFAPVQEVRFAVVLFGGVSLAVYINGVVQELLHLVRASAQGPEQDGQKVALLDEGTEQSLSSSEKIYRELAMYLPVGESDGRKISTRFVIDLISGSSAGGINGIFLAKALTHNLDLRSLARLWEKEGDLGKLLNDKLSYEGLPIQREKKPGSLLNSRRMTFKLLKAFQSMKRLPGEKEHPLVDELELQATATDLRGRLMLLRVGDRKIYERRHRHIFHFRFAAADASTQGVDQLADEFDPFLTFVARATSSFPVAFEPATLAEVENLIREQHPFEGYRKYLGSPNWRALYEEYRSALAALGKDGDQDFRRVAFGDGGILDNKPFSRVFEAIGRRRGGIPVDRKLVYVEPSPEHPEQKEQVLGSPDVLETLSLSTVVLPGAETIREDLDQLEKYQVLARRVEIAKLGQSDDIAHSDKKDPESLRIQYEDWKKADLRQMINLYGIGYGPYHRLKVSNLMIEMAALLTSRWGWQRGSEIQNALHEVLKVWRENNYQIYREEDPDPTLLKIEVHRKAVRLEVEGQQRETLTENELLGELDLWWGLRRIRHVREQLGEMVLNAETLGRHATHLFPKIEIPKGGYNDDQMDKARETARDLSLRLGLVQNSVEAELERAASSETLSDPAALQRLELKLLEILRSDGTLRSRDEQKQMVGKALSDRYIGPLLQAGIEDLMQVLRDLVKRVQSEPKNTLRSALCPIKLGAESWSPEELIEKLAAYHYRYFEQYDVAVYPMLYGTGCEEASPIDIVRISPEDASRLYDQRDKGRDKLAGSKLFHFGAFCDAEGRRHDRIWGRLDAAERILETLVSDPEKRRPWIERVQEEIVRDELGGEAEKALGVILSKKASVKERHDGNGDEEAKAAAEYFKKHDPQAHWFHELPEKQREALLRRMQGLLEPQALLKSFVAASTERDVDERRLLLTYLPRMAQVFEKVLSKVADGGAGTTALNWVQRFIRVLVYPASELARLLNDEAGKRKRIREALAVVFGCSLVGVALYTIGVHPALWIVAGILIPTLAFLAVSKAPRLLGFVFLLLLLAGVSWLAVVGGTEVLEGLRAWFNTR